jgi:hypothetical protein
MAALKMAEQPGGQEVVRMVREKTGPKTMLAFSTGKDCIAAHLAIRDHFDEVIPFYLYLVPGLEFVDEALDYYERTLFGGRRIVRMPHPSLYRWINGNVYQSPERVPVIEAARLPEFDYKNVHDLIRDQFNLKGAMVATGVRAADSPMRRMSIMRHGPISKAKGEYFPVWDWRKADLLEAFERHDIKLTRDYEVWGRSFDGLDARFLIPMKKHFPADFKKVLEWFPLAEADIFRAERMHQ